MHLYRALNIQEPAITQRRRKLRKMSAFLDKIVRLPVGFELAAIPPYNSTILIPICHSYSCGKLKQLRVTQGHTTS